MTGGSGIANRFVSWLGLVTAIVFIGQAVGAQPIADLEVVVTKSLPSVTPPGSTGTFAYRLTNLGPARAGGFDDSKYTISVGVDGIIVNDGIGPEVVLSNASGPICFLLQGYIDPIPGDPLQIVYTHAFQPMAPGQSVTCEVRYFVSNYIGGDRDIEWSAFSSLDDDPNPANDGFILKFRLAPEPIPTLSHAGLAVLAASLFASFLLVWPRFN